jgi:Flp pilus assembly protein TadB
MATNDSADSTVQEADRRAERAKASLLSRVELLKHRLTDAKHRLDPQTQIAKHPLPAVGIAFALGVVAALGRTRSATSGDAARHSLGGAALAGLAALGLRIVRELAMAQVGHVAKQWWTEHEGVSPAEPPGSRLADAEPFLEH